VAVRELASPLEDQLPCHVPNLIVTATKIARIAPGTGSA
jgi:hypothetical protein